VQTSREGPGILIWSGGKYHHPQPLETIAAIGPTHPSWTPAAKRAIFLQAYSTNEGIQPLGPLGAVEFSKDFCRHL
jgi:hypothetical protein